MLRNFIILAFIVFTSDSYSQDTLILTGHYYGKNLYVLNPSDDTAFCINDVIVNAQSSKDELHSNSFEVDFSLLNIQNGAEVKVFIIYKKGCKIQVVNPEAIQPPSSFTFISAKSDKTGKITWLVKGDVFNSFIIEQFRWKKWITLGEVDITDTIKKNFYSFDILKPHYGQNNFRISHTDAKGNIVYSKLIKYRPATLKEVFITSMKVTENITFTGETTYEVFDEKGNYIMEGEGIQVRINDLPKGKYWINYDNKTELITKK